MTQKPTDQLLESLSAMVDGEASELELRRILNNLDEDPAVLGHWHRYHLVGAAMRKEAHVSCSTNLLAAISYEIHGESRIDAMQQKPKSKSVPVSSSVVLSQVALSQVALPQTKWKTAMGQSMVAASIAATFVLGFHFLGDPGEGSANLPQLVNSARIENQTRAVADNVPIGFDLPLPEARVVRAEDSSFLQAKSMHQSDAQSQSAMRYSDDLSDFATQQLLDELLIEHAGRASVNGSLGLMPFARVSKMGTGK